MHEQAHPEQWRKRICDLGFEVPSSAALAAGAPNQAMIEGLSLASLVEEYGSPLLVVSERMCKSVVATLSDLTGTLGASLRPAVRLHRGALNDLTSVRVFSPVAASPTQELLRRLENWNVGIIAQSSGELERALRAGSRPSNIILCGAFKSAYDISLAARIGLRAVEIESFDELDELCSEEMRLTPRQSPLRICLRVEVSCSPVALGLRPDEILVAIERVRRLDHLVCVGISVGWRECSACDVTKYDEILKRLRILASNLQASGHPIEFVMVGPRSHLHLENRPDGTIEGEDYLRLTREHFHNAPFRVYFSCGDAIFHRSTHKLGRVLRVARGKDAQDTCYVDIRYPEGWPRTSPLLPLECPGAGSTQRGSNGDRAATTTFLGRSSFDHEPLKFGEWQWPDLKKGDPVMLPRVGAAFAASASACSVPRPTELLVTQEGEVVVIRSRDNLDGAISNEV